MNKIQIFVSDDFNSALTKILENLSFKQALGLTSLLDNLVQILTLFPETYPLIQFKKYCEIPFRKAVIDRHHIVVYFYQKYCIYFVNIFDTRTDWKERILQK